MGRCRCRLAPLMYIEFSAELAEPGGLIVGPEVEASPIQQRIISMIQEWEAAGLNPRELELIGLTQNEMEEYLRMTLRQHGINIDAVMQRVAKKARGTVTPTAQKGTEGLNAKVCNKLAKIESNSKSQRRQAVDEMRKIGDDLLGTRRGALDIAVAPKSEMGSSYGRYFSFQERIEIREDEWAIIQRFLKSGKAAGKLSPAEEEAFSTLLHEWMHSTNLRHLANGEKAYKWVANNLEEGLTEISARYHLREFLKKLGFVDNQITANVTAGSCYQEEVAILEWAADRLGISAGKKADFFLQWHKAASVHREFSTAGRLEFYMNELEDRLFMERGLSSVEREKLQKLLEKIFKNAGDALSDISMNRFDVYISELIGTA